MYVRFSAVQLVLAALFGVALPLGTNIFALGTIHVTGGLVLAATVWAALECGRRVLFALTSTERGLREWRRINPVFAVVNLGVSLLGTGLVGVSGPLIGTIVASILACAWISVRCISEIRECVGV